MFLLCSYEARPSSRWSRVYPPGLRPLAHGERAFLEGGGIKGGLVNLFYRKNVIFMWSYRCYDDGQATTLWQRWYDATPAAQGSHTSVFDILEQQVQWRPPWTKLVGKKKAIVEVRLSGADRIEWRVLGFYGSQRQEFVIVAICNHKGRVYDPPDILDTAIKRRNEILKDPTKAISCVRPQ